MLLERRVVDQDIELAEFIDGLLDRGLAERIVRNIAGDGDAAPALRFDGAFGFLGVGVLIR
jgi:hypothetical protein